MAIAGPPNSSQRAEPGYAAAHRRHLPLHQDRLHHVGAGHLCARRRLHRPGAGYGFRAPGCHHESLPHHFRTGHLSGGGPAGIHFAHPRSVHHRAGALRLRAEREGRAASVTKTCRTSSPSWASTSCRMRTSSLRRGELCAEGGLAYPEGRGLADFFGANLWRGDLAKMRGDRTARRPRRRR